SRAWGWAWSWGRTWRVQGRSSTSRGLSCPLPRCCWNEGLTRARGRCNVDGLEIGCFSSFFFPSGSCASFSLLFGFSLRDSLIGSALFARAYPYTYIY
ncbi:hypothetical protein HETIRDRAFT_470074, partial [Heterobasidion irregulare TC 32-1]